MKIISQVTIVPFTITGEYKAFKKDDNKCYVQGKNETASFLVNENKIFKLPINQLTLDYNEFVIDNPIKKINNKMYAPINSIGLAFNVYIKYFIL